MTPRPLRVLLVATHPVQYGAPLFRALAKDARLDIQVAYCDMGGAEERVDRDFGVAVKWDIPLLDGYRWVHLRNRSLRPGVGRFFGFFNPGVWRLISRGNFDAVVVYTGYVYATFWMALAAAKSKRVPIFFGTDAHELVPPDAKRWKIALKKWLWPRLFGLADRVIVHSSGGAALMHSLGIADERVALFPYCVDNDWWIEQSRSVDRGAVRGRWKVPGDAIVVLFCAKLQPWKRPGDLLAAFARAAGPNAHLVFAGDGALRQELEAQAKTMGVAERVHFLGFVNQSGLPETYGAADVLVLQRSRGRSIRSGARGRDGLRFPGGQRGCAGGDAEARARGCCCAAPHGPSRAGADGELVACRLRSRVRRNDREGGARRAVRPYLPASM